VGVARVREEQKLFVTEVQNEPPLAEGAEAVVERAVLVAETVGKPNDTIFFPHAFSSLRTRLDKAAL